VPTVGAKKGTAMRYIVGCHTPGYLPEGEPYVVEDETLARQALAADIEADWDTEDEVAPIDCISSVEISNRYLDAHTEVNTLSIPGSVHVPGPTPTHLGRTYWIEVAQW
jgi:hypothetical protein